MAFIAAFPDFPCEDWPLWDPRISMEGEFISYWMSNIDVGRSHRVARQMIWSSFENLAVALFPLPLFDL